MQKINPLKVVLKNGQTILIRQASTADAKQLLIYIKTYIAQSNYISQYHHELTLSIQELKEWISKLNSSENSLLLIAEFENTIIGKIEITGNAKKMMAHTAVISIGMLHEWSNMGLGYALLTTATNWSKANPTLELLWLQVLVENTLGMYLCKKIKFQEAEVIPNYFKNEDNYLDNQGIYLNVK